MSTQQKVRFLVLDSMNGPNGGQILRLRLQNGEAPPLRSLKGATLAAEGPDGSRSTVKVKGFPLFGGRPSDARFSRTGRVDLHVEAETPNAPPVGLRWEVALTG